MFEVCVFSIKVKVYDTELKCIQHKPLNESFLETNLIPKKHMSFPFSFYIFSTINFYIYIFFYSV